MRTATRHDGPTELDAALAAATRGWAVFPLRPDDKRPAVRSWEARATTDRARIERCWTSGPYGIGVATGPSGLVVLDLDTPKGGESPPDTWNLPGVADGADALAVLAERHGAPFPTGTHTVRTASGGLHLYFQAPDRGLRNSSGVLGWLVDTRAAGGYVVGAGSTVAGRTYTVVDDADPASLPTWLAELLTRPEPDPAPADPGALGAQIARQAGYGGAALRGELQRVLDAREGSRNHTLNQAAYALGRLVAARVLPYDLAADALAQAGEATGLPARECRATVRSGLEAGERHPRGGAA